MHRCFALGALALVTALLASCEPRICCTEEAECADGLLCHEGRCTHACTSDQGCVASEVCVRSSTGQGHVCVAPGEDQGECRERTAPPTSDAGGEDAGRPPDDAGAPLDAGTPDDGGSPVDAGTPPDAGTAGDAGEECSDVLEPNDSPSQASAGYPSPVSLEICQHDDDWLRVDVAAGQRVVAAMDFSHSRGDLDMELSDPSGALVASSTGVSDGEQLEHVAATSGPYLLHVYGFAEATGPYDLEVSVLEDEPCSDDPLEDNDTPDTATPLALPGEASATSCLGDLDVFRVQPAGAQQLSVALQAPSTLSVTVARLSTGSLVGTVVGGAGPTSFDLGPGGGGPLLLVVLGSASADYTLSVE